MGPRPAFQDRIDGGQVHPFSEVGRPAFATVTDDLHTDERASECRVVCPGVDADICSFFHQLKILATPEGGKLILWKVTGVSLNVSRCSLSLINYSWEEGP